MIMAKPKQKYQIMTKLPIKKKSQRKDTRNAYRLRDTHICTQESNKSQNLNP